jgi:hypothetical protein
LSTSERRKKQKLLLKKKAATMKQAAIAALALALVKLSEANAEGNESEEPSDTESENVEDIVDFKAARRSAKIEALERLVEEKKRANNAKEMEMLRLVETPVTSGPPKNQQAITHFFAREDALAREEVENYVNRRREKGLGWYSRMRKTSEEIQEMRIQMRQKKAEGRGQAAASRAAKARQKKEEEANARRQEAKDKKTALAIYNKYYKEDYAKKLDLGHKAKRKKILDVTKRMNVNFEITNQLNALEQKD